MKIRDLLVFAIAVVLSCQVVWAGPVEDSAKEYDAWDTLEVTTKFSALYGWDSSYGDSGWSSSSSHHGGAYEEARRILIAGLRQASHEPSAFQQAQILDRAVRDALRVSQQGASRFARALSVLRDAAAAVSHNFGDRVDAMRGGMEYLVRSSPGSMTKVLCTLGGAMTRPAMSSHLAASEILRVVLAAAEHEAQQENERQWASLLAFARRAVQDLMHFETKYALQSRVARAIVDARPGEAVFLKALASVAQMNLGNSYSQVQIIVTGLRQYQQDVPFENHRNAAEYLAALRGDFFDTGRAVRMYRAIMPNLVRLDTTTPGARVVLRAGIEIAGLSFLTGLEAYNGARRATEMALRLGVPSHVADTLRFGIREADKTFDYTRKARILRDYMQRAVR